MNSELIRSDEEYRAALVEIEALMNAEFGTPEGNRLNALASLVAAYEAEHS
jgi:HTH-type transcriptional regulator/antitoxin HigA